MPYPLIRRRNGFTLIDILVAVAIIAIVLVFGVPTLRNTVQQNQISTQANALVIALNYARSEAINRNLPVIVCAAAIPSSGTSPSTCSGGTTWNNGWIVFTDTNGNDYSNITGAPTQSDTVLRVHGALSGGTLVNLNTGATPPAYIRYLPSGLLDTQHP